MILWYFFCIFNTFCIHTYTQALPFFYFFLFCPVHCQRGVVIIIVINSSVFVCETLVFPALNMKDGLAVLACERLKVRPAGDYRLISSECLVLLTSVFIVS